MSASVLLNFAHESFVESTISTNAKIKAKIIITTMVVQAHDNMTNSVFNLHNIDTAIGTKIHASINISTMNITSSFVRSILIVYVE